MTTLAETLDETVARCRRLGIVRWRGPISDPQFCEVEFELGPVPQTPVAPLDTEAKVKKLVKPGKRGRDGLTFEQQVETFGAAIDATPDIYEE